MKVRNKVFLMMIIVAVVSYAALFFIFHLVVFRGFQKIERDRTQSNLQRIEAAFSNSIAQLSTMARDYAMWDDTYFFLQDRTGDYIEKNFVEDTLMNLTLNVVYLFDVNGKVVFQRGFDLGEKKITPIADSFSQLVQSDPLSLIRDACAGKSKSGIYNFSGTPFLVAVWPVLRSNNTGPVRGALLFGRFLDNQEIDKLRKLTQLNFTLRHTSELTIPEEGNMLEQFSDKARYLTIPVSSNKLLGYTLFPDISGKHSFLVTLEVSREIYQQGFSSFIQLGLLVFSVLFLLFVFLFVFLEKEILSRLHAVSTKVATVSDNQGFLSYVSIDGDDEIAGLAHEINKMLSKLESSHQKLLEGEDRFKFLIQNASDVITVIDQGGTIHYQGPSSERVLGYNSALMLGKNFFEYIHPDDLESVKKAIQEAFPKGGQPVSINYRYRRSDGAWIYLESIAHDFLLEKEIEGLVFNSRDITERKMAEKKIAESEAKFRTIFNNSAVAITVTDKEENIISWNPFTEILLGMTTEDLYMKNVSILYPEEEWLRIRQENIREKGIQHHFETCVLRKDGTLIEVDISISVLRNENNEITGSIGVIRDIAETKKAERALRQSQERYRDLVDNVNNIIFKMDTTGRINFWNKFAALYFGFSADEAIGRSFIGTVISPGVFQGDYLGGLLEEIQQNSGKSISRITEHMKKGGEGTWVFWTYRPIFSDQGLLEEILCVGTDITERKQIEQLKDDFIGTASHELRTPMAIIRESVSQILGEMHGKITQAQRELLNVTLGAIDRLGRIVNDLLDVSKLEAGKMQLRKEIVDITALAKTIIDGFFSRAQAKRVELKMRFSHSVIEAYVDKDKIIQVFTNLVDNALKFTNEGFIEISILQKDKDRVIECSVLDTGRGIASENLPKLFSKFEQFGRIHEGQEKGTGLGLAICKGIVEAHGGKITVTSKPEEGTRFTFTIPTSVF